MATRDDAPFVNEDGQKTETQSANVLSGDSGLLTGAPKAQRPDFGSVADMRAKFPAQMLSRPAMSLEEQQRASHIPKDAKEREQDVRSRGVRVQNARRRKAWDAKYNHNVDKE